MENEIKRLPNLAKDRFTAHQKFLKKLKQKKPKDLDRQMQKLHDETFDEIDCLNCANCCKTTGPLLTNKDIERISKYLKLKPAEFIDQYLRIDEDQDYVMQSLPCPFLGHDNYCMIYDVRPKACAEYPHTDRKKFYQINHLTLKNTSICPATFAIVEKMLERIKL
jgi:hypothetical protein